MGRTFYEHWMGDAAPNHWQTDHVQLFRPWVETPPVLLLPEVAESTKRRLLAIKARQKGIAQFMNEYPAIPDAAFSPQRSSSDS